MGQKRSKRWVDYYLARIAISRALDSFGPGSLSFATRQHMAEAEDQLSKAAFSELLLLLDIENERPPMKSDGAIYMTFLKKTPKN